MTGNGRPAPAWKRPVLAATSALLLLVAALHEWADVRGRARVDRFFAEFTLDRRRPELAGTAKVEGTADLAMLVAARAATLDLVGSTPLAGLDPELRELWLRSVTMLPEEAAAARELALDAVAARPAWAFHALTLAELVLSDEWRQPPEKRRGAPWLEAMRLAAAWAPAAAGIRESWAASALERWPVLSSPERTEATHVLRAAMRDEEFQRLALRAAADVLGAPESLSLLPETAAALATARAVLAPTSSFGERADIEKRWVAAERLERRRAVADIVESLEAERGEKAAALAREYLQRHPVELFDDAEGRAQARTVLRAVGDGRPGSWSSDPRGSLLRWFLASPLRPGDGSGFVRASRGLTDVPDGVRALLCLHDGDERGWKRVLEASDTEGSSEWTPFFVELARRALARGAGGDAEVAAGRISRFDLGGCDVLLVRRSVARARQNGVELAQVENDFQAAFPQVLPVSAWPASGAGTLPVCVDPERDESSTLVVSAVTREPALLWWGWDGGREGTIRLDEAGEHELSFPLAGLRGRRAFSLGPLLGGGVSLTKARIVAER